MPACTNSVGRPARCNVSGVKRRSRETITIQMSRPSGDRPNETRRTSGAACASCLSQTTVCAYVDVALNPVFSAIVIKRSSGFAISSRLFPFQGMGGGRGAAMALHAANAKLSIRGMLSRDGQNRQVVLARSAAVRIDTPMQMFRDDLRIWLRRQRLQGVGEPPHSEVLSIRRLSFGDAIAVQH